MLHIALHFSVPLILARFAYLRRWQSAYLILMATMLIDLDHLLADPIYDANRCSIGFHPLHGAAPIALYCGLCVVPKFRIVGIGLVLHMFLDGLDCALM